MYNLFKTEFLKYRNSALIAAVVHLAILVFMMVATADLNANPTYNLWLLACVAASALFGILQMTAHKKPRQWIYLLQRPLAPWKIGSALVGAGFLHVLIALVLPFVIYESGRSLSDSSFIEMRHFLQLRQVVPVLLVFYLYAAFSALYPHGLKYMGFTMAVLVAVNLPGVHVGVALGGIALVALGCFYYWFKPDLEVGATNPVFIVLSELPLQFGLFWMALMFHAIVAQVGWGLLQTGPYFNPAHDTTASMRAFSPTRDALLAGLEGLPEDEGRFYRQQVELGEVLRVQPPQPGAYPVRHQRPSLDENLAMTEPDTDNTWRFMHDQMLFKGVATGTGDTVGWIGPDGFVAEPADATRRFVAVPFVLGNDFVVDARHVRQLDWDNRRIREKFSLEQWPEAAPDEYFRDSLQVAENVSTLISNTHVYLFRSAALRDFNAAAPVEARLPLPVPERIQSTQMDVLELIDGYLVAILVGAGINELEGSFVSYDHTGLFLYRAGSDGSTTLVNHRALPSGFTASQIYEGFVLAPGFRLLSDVVLGAVTGSPPVDMWPLRYHRFPAPVLMLAALSILVSAAVVAKLLQPLNVPRAAKLTWIAVAGFSGLIGLACFYLGIYRGSLMLQRKLETPDAAMNMAGVAHHA